MRLARHDRLAQLDEHQTSKPMMVGCEFNLHWAQPLIFAEIFKTP